MDVSNTPNTFARWKPIEIMLAILFLIAPLYYHPNLGGEGLRIPNNITMWMVVTIIIVYSLHFVLKHKTYVIPKYFIYIAAFPILVTLSGFVTGVEQPLKWLFRLLFIWGGLAFFFSLFQHGLKQGRIDRILFVIVISGLLHALVGVAQIWLQTDMPFWLPKSPNGVPSGLFQQINNQATFLVTVISISLFLAARPILKQKSWLRTLPLLLAVLLSAYIVGVSGSRIGALTLFISVPLLIFALRKPLLRNKRLTMLMIVMVILGFSVAFLPGHSRLVDKTIAMQSGYSGSARLGIYNISLDLVADKPLFGYGVGSFPRVFQFARPAFYEQHPDAILSPQIVTHPHNELLFWLVEGGLIAMSGLVLVVIGGILVLRQSGSTRGMAYFALLIPISLHTQVELPLYTSILHWLLLLILLTLPFRHQLTTRNITLTVAAARLASACMLLMMTVVVLLLSHTIRANWDFVAFYKGEQMENPLPIAKKNPYLSEQAQLIDMSAMLYSSIQHGLRQNVEYYVQWGHNRLQKLPDVALFRQLVDAYEFLGNKPAYCETAKQGLATYPKDERLQRAVEFCDY